MPQEVILLLSHREGRDLLEKRVTSCFLFLCSGTSCLRLIVRPALTTVFSAWRSWGEVVCVEKMWSRHPEENVPIQSPAPIYGCFFAHSKKKKSSRSAASMTRNESITSRSSTFETCWGKKKLFNRVRRPQPLRDVLLCPSPSVSLFMD